MCYNISMKKFYILLTIIALLSGIPAAQADTEQTARVQGEQEKACLAKEGIYRLQVPIIGCTPDAEPGKTVCCSEDGIYTIGVKSTPSYIATMVRFGIIVVITIMFLMLIVAGVQFQLSFGNTTNAYKALDRVKHAAMGLVVVLFSTVILYQINPDLVSLKLATPVGIANTVCCKIGGSSLATASNVGKPVKQADGTIVTYAANGDKTVLSGEPNGICKQEIFKKDVSTPYNTYTNPVDTACPFNSVFANAVPLGASGTSSSPASYYLATNLENGEFICNGTDKEEPDTMKCFESDLPEADFTAAGESGRGKNPTNVNLTRTQLLTLLKSAGTITYVNPQGKDGLDIVTTNTLKALFVAYSTIPKITVNSLAGPSRPKAPHGNGRSYDLKTIDNTLTDADIEKLYNALDLDVVTQFLYCKADSAGDISCPSEFGGTNKCSSKWIRAWPRPFNNDQIDVACDHRNHIHVTTVLGPMTLNNQSLLATR